MNADGAGTALQQLMISAGVAAVERKISPIWRLTTMKRIKNSREKIKYDKFLYSLIRINKKVFNNNQRIIYLIFF
jgi:hypothetical protein